MPGAPALSTDAEKVAAVQGAIWCFTDQFVVPRFGYPAQHDAVAVSGVIVRVGRGGAGVDPPAKAAWVAATIAAMASCCAG
ncbi:MAG: hypothetical protein IE935_08575 [Micrococcales bacterium]|nr:hypothetical protein [Micrococcales bacterium]